jgi:ATP-dependent helicase HepA
MNFQVTSFKKGQWIRLEADLELGPALIIEDKDFSVYKVKFLKKGELRQYTKKNPPFKRLLFVVGQKIRFKNQEAFSVIEKIELRDQIFYLHSAEGVFAEWDIRELSGGSDLSEIIQQKKWTAPKFFMLRFWAMMKLFQRSQSPLKGAVGCRIELLPHQLWVMSEFLKSKIPRALLADEVGLGKTVETGLILSALNAQKKIKKVLVIVPPALKVQWLTELYVKFHIRFRLEHEDMIEDSDYRDFVITSLSEIERNDEDIDLLVVDEAHRLTRDPIHVEALKKWVDRSQRVLFLTATPKASGEKEFQKMAELLGAGSKPLLFSSQRKELGIPIYRTLEAEFVKNKNQWLVGFLKKWLEKKDKSKIFLICETPEKLKHFANLLEKNFGPVFAQFHENMDLVERDRQAAYFADPSGSRILLSSEIGGEGRNFQFCHDMILLDLPADPLKVEQRIGRLDRIGQTQKVRVWCPVEQGLDEKGDETESEEEKIFELLKDTFQVFEKPWTGLGLEDGLKDSAALLKLSDSMNQKPKEKNNIEKFVTKIVYDPAVAVQIKDQAAELSKIPIKEDLEKIYECFGVDVEDFDQLGSLKVSASSLMFVENFPGLGGDGEKVISFDRPQSLAREDIQFMSVDHPDFIETLEFFLNSEQGKICISSGAKKPAVGILESSESQPPKLIDLESEKPLPEENLRTRELKEAEPHEKELKVETAIKFQKQNPNLVALWL